MKRIVHIDFNYFFVQVEELFDKSLRNVPCAVGSTLGRGIISTSNYLARSFGVRSGMAVSMALKACPQLKLVHEHYREYSKISNKIFKFLRSKFNILNQVSCDECFIDMTEYLKGQNEYDTLRDLQFDIYNKFQIKVSIGLSYTTFLAKMASDYKKPLGLTIITPENREEILYPIKIKDFYGIGKKTAPILEKNGIETIGDLVNNKFNMASSILKNQYSYCLECALGHSSDIVEVTDFDPKSCSAMTTFDTDTNDYEEIKNALTDLTRKVSKELQQYHKKAKTIVLTLRDTTFTTKSRRTTLSKYTDDTETILNAGLKIFAMMKSDETAYRLVGIGVDNLIETEGKITENVTTDDIINIFNKELNSDLLFKANEVKKTEE